MSRTSLLIDSLCIVISKYKSETVLKFQCHNIPQTVSGLRSVWDFYHLQFEPKLGDYYLRVILNVIPAKAGIQSFQAVMDSRFRGSDTIFVFLRIHQIMVVKYLMKVYVGAMR